MNMVHRGRLKLLRSLPSQTQRLKSPTARAGCESVEGAQPFMCVSTRNVSPSLFGLATLPTLVSLSEPKLVYIGGQGRVFDHMYVQGAKEA
jgi:hypothetical protein